METASSPTTSLGCIPINASPYPHLHPDQKRIQGVRERSSTPLNLQSEDLPSH